MLNTRNIWTGSGRLTADPEVINDNVTKFSLAIDFAGPKRQNAKGEDTSSGFFDVVVYTNNDNSAITWFKNQVSEGKMAKGSPVSILGSLYQEMWEDKDGNKRNKVVVVAERVDYAAGMSSKDAGEGAPAKAAGAVPSDF